MKEAPPYPGVLFKQVAMRTRCKAFSLVEILVVTGLVVLLFAIAFPVIHSLNKESNIGSATARTLGQLELAQQLSLARKPGIEVRIYETRNADGSLFYNAIALYRAGDDADADGKPDSFNLENKTVVLPQGSVFATGGLSTLISEVPLKGEDSLLGQNKLRYSAFRFKSSGGADLSPRPDSGKPWSLTIVPRKDSMSDRLLQDYAVLTLDTSTGKVQVTRSISKDANP